MLLQIVEGNSVISSPPNGVYVGPWITNYQCVANSYTFSANKVKLYDQACKRQSHWCAYS